MYYKKQKLFPVGETGFLNCNVMKFKTKDWWVYKTPTDQTRPPHSSSHIDMHGHAQHLAEIRLDEVRLWLKGHMVIKWLLSLAIWVLSVVVVKGCPLGTHRLQKAGYMDGHPSVPPAVSPQTDVSHCMIPKCIHLWQHSLGSFNLLGLY